MGDPNASIPTPQPMHYRPQFGSYGKGARTTTSMTFVSQSSMNSDFLLGLGLQKSPDSLFAIPERLEKDMILNDSLPKMEVDPETYTVKADGEELHCESAKVVPLAQRYFSFLIMIKIKNLNPINVERLNHEISLTVERRVLAKRRWRGQAEDGTDFGFGFGYSIEKWYLFSL